MSGFKGTINMNGRPKNALGKVNKEVKEIIADIVSNKLLEVQERMEELPFKTQVDVVLKLLPYVAPQLRAIELDDKSETLFKPIVLNFSNDN